MQRDTFANFFHDSEDFVNAFLALAVLQWAPGDVQVHSWAPVTAPPSPPRSLDADKDGLPVPSLPPQVLLTDLYPQGPFWPMWSDVFSRGEPALTAWALRNKYGHKRSDANPPGQYQVVGAVAGGRRSTISSPSDASRLAQLHTRYASGSWPWASTGPRPPSPWRLGTRPAPKPPWYDTIAHHTATQTHRRPSRDPTPVVGARLLGLRDPRAGPAGADALRAAASVHDRDGDLHGPARQLRVARKKVLLGHGVVLPVPAVGKLGRAAPGPHGEQRRRGGEGAQRARGQDLPQRRAGMLVLLPCLGPGGPLTSSLSCCLSADGRCGCRTWTSTC